jgi:hypothetical protein
MIRSLGSRLAALHAVAFLLLAPPARAEEPVLEYPVTYEYAYSAGFRDVWATVDYKNGKNPEKPRQAEMLAEGIVRVWSDGEQLVITTEPKKVEVTLDDGTPYDVLDQFAERVQLSYWLDGAATKTLTRRTDPNGYWQWKIEKDITIADWSSEGKVVVHELAARFRMSPGMLGPYPLPSPSPDGKGETNCPHCEVVETPPDSKNRIERIMRSPYNTGDEESKSTHVSYTTLDASNRRVHSYAGVVVTSAGSETKTYLMDYDRLEWTTIGQVPIASLYIQAFGPEQIEFVRSGGLDAPGSSARRGMSVYRLISSATGAAVKPPEGLPAHPGR